ncbi:MAG: hypothetical protein K6G64_04235 [Eubacterium sp.]|nr:hypothetical protein [Eubacterium sp.]
MKSSKKIERIEVPTKDIVNECIKEFDENNSEVESSIRKLFDEFDDSSFEKILVKVIVLNNRYSTGLNDNQLEEGKKDELDKKGKKYPVDVITMAKHILGLSEEIAKVKNPENVINLVNKMSDLGEQYKKAYSFATKYCAWTLKKMDNPMNIPIVDSFVKGFLYYLNEKEEAGLYYKGGFAQKNLNDYDKFCKIYKSFIEKYDFLSDKTYKEIDKYIWQYSKNLLKKNNGKEPIDIRIYN